MLRLKHIRVLALSIIAWLYIGLPATLAAGPGAASGIFPRPGAKLVSPRSDIVIRPGSALAPLDVEAEALFRVSGSYSGAIRGAVFLAEDRKTLIFRPERSFQPGETVTVRLRRGLRTVRGTEIDALDFRFAVSATPEAVRREFYESPAAGTPASMPPAGDRRRFQSGMHFFGNDSLPADFPAITVDTLDNPAPGYLFLGLWQIDLAGGPPVLPI